ncbi:NAD(P)-binding domain-containing protein [Salipiger sp. P9]|uniref:pyrroline-5-carboxylate reductase family protein n=1 Tax=Salipiger pentaromativorans TaxID=2943193 RepID=UPI0021589361|nr:pyrroline-5-carboxylate reductase dimerization domain-containing protein [Salipiger pentaromativorans]MCR8546558.1 NAD(P)-binding domain-containing protein [Salipiger pentaromativorans]
MPDVKDRIGIVGGSGMLGSAIVQGLIASGSVTESALTVLNRSGSAGPLARFPGLALTTDPQTLCASCGTLLLCVPPAQAAGLRLPAGGHLVLSVMAGVTRAALSRITGSPRVIRAMSSPAAALRLAYTPWIASDPVSAEDRQRATRLFEAIGTSDEVASEALIDQFTALTGPVPGFVAFFADAMTRYAIDAGAPPDLADRAIRQLFLAGGRMLAEGDKTPAAHVAEMIDYAGTTAAGLTVMEEGPIRAAIAEGLAAAADRARGIG